LIHYHVSFPDFSHEFDPAQRHNPEAILFPVPDCDHDQFNRKFLVLDIEKIPNPKFVPEPDHESDRDDNRTPDTDQNHK
jgi:hypothetical protein